MIIPWRCQLISEIGTTSGAEWGQEEKKRGLWRSVSKQRQREAAGGIPYGVGGVSVVRWLGDWVVTAIVGYAIK